MDGGQLTLVVVSIDNYEVVLMVTKFSQERKFIFDSLEQEIMLFVVVTIVAIICDIHIYNSYQLYNHIIYHFFVSKYKKIMIFSYTK